MPRSNASLPPDLQAEIDALGFDEQQALAATWKMTASAAPPADPARKAHTWSVLRTEMAASRPARPSGLRRVARPSADAPLWRVYALGVAASLALLVAVGLWLNPATTRYSTTEQTRTVALADGSTVTLAPHTTLDVGEGWPAARTVRLDGAARFEVAHDPTHPFSITTQQATVTVLGTVFTVKARDAKATSVNVERGRVAVEHGAARVELVADEQTVARPDKPLVVRITPSSAAAVFAFTDAPAAALFDEVEALFGIEVAYPASVAARRLTLTRHGPLDAEALVAGICAPLGLTYRRTATGFAVRAR